MPYLQTEVETSRAQMEADAHDLVTEAFHKLSWGLDDHRLAAKLMCGWVIDEAKERGL